MVLSGSLPPGAPAAGTPTLVRSLRDTGARIAVDTSEAPLLALLAAGPDAAPDLLKPNTEELAQLAGVPEETVPADPDAALAAVPSLHERGVAEVLLTLGGDGALLSTADGGLWSATPPRRSPSAAPSAPATAASPATCSPTWPARSPAERLRTAVAYGSASAALPGSAVPTPDQADAAAVRVTAWPARAPRCTAPAEATPSRPPAGRPLTPPGEPPCPH